MSTARTIHVDAIVNRRNDAREGFDQANGRVIQEIGRAHVVVEWPNQTQSKHHQSELRVTA
jgi:tRNA A37 threonylcarbamoyladenosine biosynthesis protein TsaE